MFLIRGHVYYDWITMDFDGLDGSFAAGVCFNDGSQLSSCGVISRDGQGGKWSNIIDRYCVFPSTMHLNIVTVLSSQHNVALCRK